MIKNLNEFDGKHEKCLYNEFYHYFDKNISKKDLYKYIKKIKKERFNTLLIESKRLKQKEKK